MEDSSRGLCVLQKMALSVPQELGSIKVNRAGSAMQKNETPTFRNFYQITGGSNPSPYGTLAAQFHIVLSQPGPISIATPHLFY